MSDSQLLQEIKSDTRLSKSLLQVIPQLEQDYDGVTQQLDGE